jgi:hypothetical protein
MIDRFPEGSTYLFIWASKAMGVRAQQPGYSDAEAQRADWVGRDPLPMSAFSERASQKRHGPSR